MGVDGRRCCIAPTGVGGTPRPPPPDDVQVSRRPEGVERPHRASAGPEPAARRQAHRVALQQRGAYCAAAHSPPPPPPAAPPPPRPSGAADPLSATADRGGGAGGTMVRWRMRRSASVSLEEPTIPGSRARLPREHRLEELRELPVSAAAVSMKTRADARSRVRKTEPSSGRTRQTGASLPDDGHSGTYERRRP